MNIKKVINYIGRIVALEGIFMFLPFLVAFIYHEHNGVYFLYTGAFLILFGLIVERISRSDDRFYSAEGFVTVAIGWIALSIFGAIPFYISKEIPDFIDAVFETVSGYSTTGATILTDVTMLSMCMNFWRCFTHFVGGMGVLVLILAIIPTQSDNFLVMKAESPGPQVGKLLPKVSETARSLYIIYVAITIVAIISYILSGMPIYDSICIGMGTAGTGGFVVSANGCGDYSDLSQTLIAIFMLLVGVNFNLYYLITIRKINLALKSEEFRWYLLIIFIAVILIAININIVAHDGTTSLHNAFFQVSSIITTTGFAICDYTLWPLFSRMILVILMIIGGCAGSTAGGFKVSRIIINIKSVMKELYYQLHPNSVNMVRFEGRVVASETVRSVLLYTILYVLIIIFGILIISVENLDFETVFSSVIETFNNIGLGLSKIGPNGNFSIFSSPSKIIFIILMLTGRLEILPMIILFSKNTWKRSR